MPYGNTQVALSSAQAAKAVVALAGALKQLPGCMKRVPAHWTNFIIRQLKSHGIPDKRIARLMQLAYAAGYSFEDTLAFAHVRLQADLEDRFPPRLLRKQAQVSASSIDDVAKGIALQAWHDSLPGRWHPPMNPNSAGQGKAAEILKEVSKMQSSTRNLMDATRRAFRMLGIPLVQEPGGEADGEEAP